jgi:acetyl esterase/lipase
MSSSRPLLNAALSISLAFLASTSLAAEEPLTLPLWPAAAPGEQGDIAEESVQAARQGDPIARISNVSKPTLTVYPAPKDKNTGTAVLVCPGGGYNILAIEHEGTDVARWLNSHGVTAIVLKYRVPRRKNRDKHEAPLQDAQRAMSLVRSRAKEWGYDPERIGILGFSAGGHLAATTATNFDRRAYEPIDEADQASIRPNFAILVYPAYLVENGKLQPEIRVSPESPPTFFAHAGDDRIGPENSIAMYQALKQAGVPGELHIFSTGGHGFGMRPGALPANRWPDRAAEWLRTQKLISE